MFVLKCFALALLLFVQGGYAAERAVALVIGNANYAVKPLANPVRDAQLVADALVRAGFPREGVVLRSDLKRKPLRAALEEFVALAASADTALLYFSGHGMQPSSGGESYLIPVDADITSDADLRADAYALGELLAALEALQQRAPRRTVIIVDACRDAPFAAKFKNARRGLARPESNLPQTLVAYATGYNRVAWDGDGRNGPYAQALAAHLAQARERPLLALFDDVKRDVLQRTRHLDPPQQPTRYGDMDTSTYLLGSGPSQPATEPPRLVSAPAQSPEPVAPRPPRVGDTFRDCAECPEVVVLPAGSFRMGDLHGDGVKDEKPVRTVRIAQAFAMGKYEVTVGEFRRFVAASGHRTDAERNAGGEGCAAWDASNGKWAWREGRDWRSPGFSQDDSHPVVCVSWNDAQAYIRWLSERSGQRYRLSSEAEFEYALRAGGRTKWPWGDDASGACGYANVADQTNGPSGYSWIGKHECRDGYFFTAPVGRFQPNAFGLFDLSGNVWEWVQDCDEESGYDKGQPVDGSAHEPDKNCARRVARGGGWGSNARVTGSANRNGDAPVIRGYVLGFRLSRTLP